MLLAVVQVGLQVALLAASFLLRPKPEDIEGARLQDTGVSTSGYGSDLKIGLGTVRLSGEVIWVKGNQLDEVRSSEEAGGKGGGGVTVTSYAYFATFAVSFAEGPAQRVRRIWMNSKLVYDVDAEVPQKEGLEFRFYKGDANQLPDPLIDTDITARVAANSTPAYRGQAYIVFIDLPLADFGNGMPNVEAELEFSPGGTTAFSTTTRRTFNTYGDSNSFWVIDHDLARFYYSNDNVLNLADRFAPGDLNSLALLGNGFTTTTDGGFLPMGIDPEGNVLAIGDNHTINMLVDPYAGVITKSGAHGVGGSSGNFGRGAVKIRVVSPIGELALFVGSNDSASTTFPNQDTGITVAITYADDVDFGKNFIVYNPYSSSEDVRFSNPVVAGEGQGRAWIVAHHQVLDTITIHEFQITGPLPAHITGLRSGLRASEVASFTTSDFDSQGGGVLRPFGPTCAYDPSDGTLVTFAHLTSPSRTFIFKWSPSLGIVWKTETNGVEPNLATLQHKLVGQQMAWSRDSNDDQLISMVNLNDGSLVFEDLNIGNIFGNGSGGEHWAWDDTKKVLYIMQTALGWIGRVRIGATAALGVLKSDIISTVCQKAGLDAADIDVTGVTGEVGGWTSARQNDGQGLLQPFIDAFAIDAFTNAGKLTFQDRGGAFVGTLKEEDLLEGEENRFLSFRKVQESELPETVSVVFRDKDNDHLDADQAFKRIRLPSNDRTIISRSDVTLSLPISDSGANMRALAVQRMTEFWNSRDIFEARAPINFVQYNPGDALTLERLDGSQQRVRVAAMPLGTEGAFDVTLVGEVLEQYSATIAAETGSHQSQTIVQNSPSKPFLLNTTILRDLDATDRSHGRMIWGAAPFAEGAWPGALLYRLLGNTDFDLLSRAATPLDRGSLVVAPPTTDRAHFLEQGSSFEAVMVRGGDDLTTTTELNVLNGSNTVLICKDNGQGEVLSFVQIADLGNDLYRFTDLIRGRKGTEWAMGSVAVGDKVVILTRVSLEGLAMALSEVNVSRTYKVVTSGSFIDLASPFMRSYLGNDLKPWAPGQITAQDSSGDIVFNWVRRTRHSGEWLDGNGSVPLNEDSEEYEIDILDGPGGTIVQTATGLTSPTYTYPSADVTSDFGSVPATIDVRVYQISAQVGRGFTNETNVEVT